MNLIRARTLFKKHFENSFTFYFILFFIFTLGITFGAILIKALDENIRLVILEYSNAYFNTAFHNNFGKISVFKKTFFNNMFFVVALYLSGLINLGLIITPLIVFINGSLLGYSVGYLIYANGFKGFFISLLGIYPQYLFYTIAIISIGALSMTMSYKYKFSMSLKIKTRKLEMTDYTIIVFLLTILMIIGCLYEGFVSPFFLNLTNEFL